MVDEIRVCFFGVAILTIYMVECSKFLIEFCEDNLMLATWME